MPLPRIEGIEPQLPGRFAVLPLRDTVMFPQHIVPLFIGREKSVHAVEHALDTDRFVFLTAQRDVKVKSPAPEDLYTMGTVCLLLRMIRVKERKMKILVQGLCKARILDIVQAEPFLIAEVEKKEADKSGGGRAESEKLIAGVKEKLDELIFTYGKPFPADIQVVIENLEDPEKLAHLIAGNIVLQVSQAQEILELSDPLQKLIRVDDMLDGLIRTAQ